MGGWCQGPEPTRALCPARPAPSGRRDIILRAVQRGLNAAYLEYLSALTEVDPQQGPPAPSPLHPTRSFRLTRLVMDPHADPHPSAWDGLSMPPDDLIRPMVIGERNEREGDPSR